MSTLQTSRRQIKLLTVVVCCATLLACAVRRVQDYKFSVAGLVTDERGMPLQDAQVTIEVKGLVYNGLMRVRTERVLTNSGGGFLITRISHEPDVKYMITVRKNGFEPQTFSGSAPPDGHHTVRLRKTS